MDERFSRAVTVVATVAALSVSALAVPPVAVYAAEVGTARTGMIQTETDVAKEGISSAPRAKHTMGPSRAMAGCLTRTAS